MRSSHEGPHLSRAAAYAIERANGWEIGRRGRSERISVKEADVARVLGSTPDVIELNLKTYPDVENRLEAEWSKDRALRLLIILLDPQEALEGLCNVARLLERLLDKEFVIESIENQFCQSRLPDEAVIDRVVQLASNFPKVSGLLSRIIEWQSAIGQVAASFDAIPDEAFGGDEKKYIYRESAISVGAFRTLVAATNDGKLPDRAIFELHGKLKGLPDARVIVKAWVSAFERAAVAMPIIPKDIEEEFEEDLRDFGGGPGGYESLQNALEQQRAILARVADGDFDTARKFARELAQQQLASGGRPYLVKSFTRLSQNAREMEAFELELEWAFEAVQTAPEDARARTQYADALLQADRFDEALAEYNRAAELGEPGYGATGSARTLRILGRFEAALAAFSSVAEDFAGTENEIYGLVGISNVLGDMGDAEGALRRSQNTAKQFPDQPIARLHYANLLMRRGLFADAWDELCEVDKYSTDKVPILNDFAQICRRTGRLEEARKRFGAIADRYPRDINAHLGLVDTLRQLGELDRASMYARQVAEHFPGSPRAAAKHAETASELGRHNPARQILKAAITRFPKDSRLIIGRVNALRREGRYDRALATADAAVERFPHNRHIQRIRAEMLRRLGNTDAAEVSYRQLFEEDQLDAKAKNGLASILVLRREWDLAERLLANDNPVTADDWRSFFIRAELFVRRDDFVAARERLMWGLERCPFAAERRLFACGLSTLAIKAGQARRAPRIPVVAERDIGNLINFQIAVTTRNSRAETIYKSLQQFMPAKYQPLRDNIARNYGISDFKAGRAKNWIVRQLNDELLLAAA